MKERVAALVKTSTSIEWCELLEGSDACFAPVLDPDEAPDMPTTASGGPSSRWKGWSSRPRRRASAAPSRR